MMRWYGMCSVQITKTVIRKVKGLILLQKYVVITTEVERNIVTGYILERYG